jgi:threonine dehydratase
MAVTFSDVTSAASRITGLVHVTPALTCRSLSSLASASIGRDVELVFKCELFQRSGSFKMRGACNAVAQAPPGVPVCTHSSGNHAQALALAARQAGRAAHIVMPSNAPSSKRAATEGYGASVTTCAPTQAAREAAAAAVCAATGAEFVHPSEDPRVIAGQGTLALEVLSQASGALGAAPPGAPPLDALVVPVGGGGMLGGCCVAACGVDARVVVLGAEPAGAADAARSVKAGALQGHAPGGPATIADGLRTTLGPNTWPLVRDLCGGIVEVEEGEIRAALRLVYERAKLAIEPSAAVGVAAVLNPAFGEALRAAWVRIGVVEPVGRPLRVGVVLCGGNSDLDALFTQ